MRARKKYGSESMDHSRFYKTANLNAFPASHGNAACSRASQISCASQWPHKIGGSLAPQNWNWDCNCWTMIRRGDELILKFQPSILAAPANASLCHDHCSNDAAKTLQPTCLLGTRRPMQQTNSREPETTACTQNDHSKAQDSPASAGPVLFLTELKSANNLSLLKLTSLIAAERSASSLHC